MCLSTIGWWGLCLTLVSARNYLKSFLKFIANPYKNVINKCNTCNLQILTLEFRPTVSIANEATSLN